MLEILISSSIAAAAAFFITKKIDKAKYDIYLEQAKAKAKAIEYEANLILENAKVKVQEAVLDEKKKFEKEFNEKNEKLNTEIKNIELKQKELEILEKSLKIKEDEIINDLNIKEKQLEKDKTALEKLKKIYEEKIQKAQNIIEKGAGLTKDEAKEMLIEQTKQEIRQDMAAMIRKAEQEAKKEAKKNAYWVIAQATTRYAGDFAGERLITNIHLPNDDIKGKIIGKDGRNIKTLEMLMGVDIIIDDTPNTITISNFNIYRRQIAVETIQRLIEDGRIQPAKIEETYKKVFEEFEEKVYEEGEKVLLELGIQNIADEIVKLIGRLKYRASYGQNALAHSLEVAHLAGIMAAEMGGDEMLAKRAGLLHDIGKALTYEYSGNHVDLGYDLCKRHNEHPIVLNAIKAHHGYEEIKYIETAAVCTADTLSAARPGARREVLESFLKRVQSIENIATSFEGIKMAYAVNAGREIRVIVEADIINDNETSLLAHEISKKIEKEVNYPGEIKITVIREKRVIAYAS